MKRFTSILFVIFLVAVVKLGMAQQITQYNLYNQQMFMLNPANAGDADNMQGFIDSRKQWAGKKS